MRKKIKKDFQIDFIGIGAARCATTKVYRCLLEHPQICGPYIKELNFFVTSKNPFPWVDKKYSNFLYQKGINYYENYFPHCPSNSIKGEFSTFYLGDPGAAKLIKKHFPKVKIIVCLRDPIKRACSYYWFNREFVGTEKSKSFEEAIEKNPEIYIDWGMYYKQLKRYFNLFPKKNIGIFLLDDLKKNPVKFMQKVYQFLGADKNFVPPSIKKRENPAKKTKNKFTRFLLSDSISSISKFLQKMHLYFIVEILRKLKVEDLIFFINHKVNITNFTKPPIRKSTKMKLKRIFRKDIEQLEKLLNRDLGNWK